MYRLESNVRSQTLQMQLHLCPLLLPSGFIRSTIGKPAIPYLKQAAKYEGNDRVRKQAAALAKAIR